MRLRDVRIGVERGIDSTANTINGLNQIIRTVLLSDQVPDSFKKSIMLAYSQATNQFEDATTARQISDIEKFLSGFRSLHVPIDEQYSKYRELRKTFDQLSEEGRALEESNKKNPDHIFTEEELARARQRTRLLQEQMFDLWKDIHQLALTVLAVMNQFKPPNAKELVDAFTGEP